MKPLLSLLAAVFLAAALAACGDDAAPPAPANATTPGVPARGAGTVAPDSPLQRNAAAANRFVGEGRDDLEQRLATLRGNPVVVNLWASWCGPCRFEFPFFAKAAETHGAKTAFIGVDVLDSRDGAEAFVDQEPPGFPSIYDGDGKAARSLGGGRAMPTTVFIGRDGRVAYTKLGGYAKAADLDADIRRYAR